MNTTGMDGDGRRGRTAKQTARHLAGRVLATILLTAVTAAALLYGPSPQASLDLGEVGDLPHESGDHWLQRVPRSWLFGPQTVWTDGTATPTFHPMSEPIESAGVINVRTTFEMEQNSGNCKVRPALRFSNDGTTWDTEQEYPDDASYRTTNGITWGSVYTDITVVTNAAPRAYVQFGVQAANTSAGAIQLCSVTLRIEPKEK